VLFADAQFAQRSAARILLSSVVKAVPSMRSVETTKGDAAAHVRKHR
jgi:hypothetical protein